MARSNGKAVVVDFDDEDTLSPLQLAIEEDTDKFEEQFKVRPLTRKELDEARSFTRDQALAMVRLYRSIQKARVAQSNRLSARERRTALSSAGHIGELLRNDLNKIENQAGRALKAYAESQLLGRWCMTIRGISFTTAAQLLAYIDFNRAKWVGCIYNFAGLNPKQVWEEGEKRPYNPAVKSLCWLIGENLKRGSNAPDSFYGPIYRKRKKLEVERNEAGMYAKFAEQYLQDAFKRRRRISEDQRKCWSEGKLQKVGVDRRACRYTTKIFLSHFHQVGRAMLFGEEVLPWVFVYGDHDMGSYIPPPNWPFTEE